LNFRQDPDTGTYYIAKTIQRPPCDNPREQMMVGIPEQYTLERKSSNIDILENRFSFPPQIIDEK